MRQQLAVMALAAVLVMAVAAPVLADVSLEEAGAYAEQGDYSRAVTLYTQAIDSGELGQAELEQAHVERGMALFNAGEYEAAAQDFSTVLAMNPDRINCYGARARCWRELENYPQAESDLARAMEQDPDNPEYYETRAGLRSVQGDVQGALDDYLKVAELNPAEAHLAYLNCAGLGIMTGDNRLIYDYATKALDLDPSLTKAYIFLAEALMARGEIDQAMESLEKALELDPQCAEAYSTRGVIHRRLGQLEQAYDDYGRAIEFNPDDPWTWTRRGNLLREMERYEEAVADYDQAVLLAPSPLFYYNRVGCLIRMEEYERAVEDCNRVLAEEPENSRAYFARGHALWELGDPQAALEDFTLALKYDPSNLDVYYLRAEAYRTLGDEVRAEQDLAWRAFYMAIYLSDNGELGQALGLMDQALDSVPDFADGWALMGLLQQKAGNMEQALPCMEKGLALGYNEAWLMNAVVWELATSANPALRNPERAVELGEQLLEVESTPEFMDTLAAAYAAIGEFDRAVDLQGEAMVQAMLFGQDKTPYQERLHLYQSGQAYYQSE
ncbi:MAG: tetratricopeptide repeat protein [Desulfovibrio sp.]|nr:MAG: tetratricopeptide repeat protein [Desulfovibrio sp.]